MSPDTAAGQIRIGDLDPDFELPDINMKMHKLSDYCEKIVLAFFPAAESPVCTKELCTFRDSLQDLQQESTDIIGISVDGPFANKIFTINRHLNFPLLSDYKREVINKYGIIMKDLGPLKDYDAAKRSIFIVDRDRKIRYSWISDDPLIEPNYKEIKKELIKI